jgi:oligoribonuclease
MINIQPSSTNLIWIDLEMTGLSPIENEIIEIATLVTNANLEVIEEGPVFAIYQAESVLEKMDAWNVKHHTRSGLIDRVRISTVTMAQAETETIEFLMKHIPPQKSPMCGNSIHQDRRFLEKSMPKLLQYFHYRNLDVSTLKILAQRWAPDIAKGFKKKPQHEALSDIYASIEELTYYRTHLLKY